MAVKIGVNVDMKGIMKSLKQVEKKEMPYAIEVGLNLTAKDINKRLKHVIPAYIDRPTTFTKNAFGFTRAPKVKQFATLFIKDIQEKYLRWQIKGGQQSSRGRFGVPVPTPSKKLNAYGNIAGRKSGLVKGKKQFLGKVNGIRGVWQRGTKGNPGMTLMVAFKRSVFYRPNRFPYVKLIQKFYLQRIGKNMIKGARIAMAPRKIKGG